MKLILGLVFTLLGLLLVALLVFAANQLDGQEVMTLPVEKHTDWLGDRMRAAIVARPNNIPMLVMTDSNNVVAFSITILSRMETNNIDRFLLPDKEYIQRYPNGYQTSNVIARIIWKGLTNECVLERNP